MTAKKTTTPKAKSDASGTHGIHPNLTGLAVEISSLVPLPDNPRKGDVKAIMASYQEFGQVKPIVIRPNDDGTATVIAGNHQTEAARRLGWTHIAAVPMDTDDKRALAFALAENRTMELGHTDPVLLHEAVVSVIDDYVDTFDALGWDDFQLAAMDEQAAYLSELDASPAGYVPPVMVSQPGDTLSPPTQIAPQSTPTTAEPPHIEAPPEMNVQEAVTRGSSSVGAAGAAAIVQYMLVFDDAGQQRKWYEFLKWLRSDPGTEGETTAERLLYFLDSHANYR